MGAADGLTDFYQLDDSHVMTDDRFWPRGFAALPAEYSAYERDRVDVIPLTFASTARGRG